MLSIRKTMSVMLTRPTPRRTPPLRCSLGCERLDDRVVPALTYFDVGFQDGTHGEGSFTIPIEQVDPAVEFQDVEVFDLTLTIDGAGTFTTSNAEYGRTGIRFHYGDLLGPVGYWDFNDPDVDLQLDGRQAFIFQNADGKFGQAIPKPPSVILDFSTFTTGRTYKLQVVLENTGTSGNLDRTMIIDIAAGATTNDIRTLVKTAILAKGYSVEEVGTRLNIGGKQGQDLRKLKFNMGTYTFNDSKGDYVAADPNGGYSGPTYKGRVGQVSVYSNDTLIRR